MYDSNCNTTRLPSQLYPIPINPTPLSTHPIKLSKNIKICQKVSKSVKKYQKVSKSIKK